MENEPTNQTPGTPTPPQTPPQQPQPPQKQPSGYSKRPMWQWVLLYIIVGAVVYGLIYYFFVRGNSGSGY